MMRDITKKSGEISLQSRFNNYSINVFLIESDLKNEKSIFASIINNLGRFILNQIPCLFATRCFNSSASLNACLSVNLLRDKISVAIENSKRLTNCLTSLVKAISNFPFNSIGTSTFTIISVILNNTNKNMYLNVLNISNYKNRIQVKAKPPFPCLRHGFVQQQKLLTFEGINVIQHSPFIKMMGIHNSNHYTKLAVNKNNIAEMDIQITVPLDEPPGNLTSNLMYNIDFIEKYGSGIYLENELCFKNGNEKLVLVDEVKKKDEEWRELKSELDSLRHERNLISSKINQEKRKNGSLNQADAFPRTKYIQLSDYINPSFIKLRRKK